MNINAGDMVFPIFLLVIVIIFTYVYFNIPSPDHSKVEYEKYTLQAKFKVPKGQDYSATIKHELKRILGARFSEIEIKKDK